MNILILYETQNGSTQYVVEVMKSTLEKSNHQVTLHSLKYQGVTPDIESNDVIIFGAPTYDDGKLEKTMLAFISSFKADLSQKKVAVFGLGNRTYPQFCVSATILTEYVQSCHGQVLLEPLRVDGFPDDVTPITTWVSQLLAVI